MKTKKIKLVAKDLRTMSDEEGRKLSKIVKRKPIFLILEDILDTYNVGGFFRLAEAVAVEKIYLCGKTETPPNQKIMKASVGNYKIVPWEYQKTARAAIREIRKIYKDIQVVAIEQSPRSKDYRKIKYKFPLAFVSGNENFGMKKSTLKLVDEIAEVPMHGLNSSLNVMVAAGIVVYRGMEED